MLKKKHTSSYNFVWWNKNDILQIGHSMGLDTVKACLRGSNFVWANNLITQSIFY